MQEGMAAPVSKCESKKGDEVGTDPCSDPSEWGHPIECLQSGKSMDNNKEMKVAESSEKLPGPIEGGPLKETGAGGRVSSKVHKQVSLGAPLGSSAKAGAGVSDSGVSKNVAGAGPCRGWTNRAGPCRGRPLLYLGRLP